MLSEKDIYKAVSDLISDCYDWLTDTENEDRVQYVLGLNDMARYLVEQLRKKEKCELNVQDAGEK